MAKLTWNMRVRWTNGLWEDVYTGESQKAAEELYDIATVNENVVSARLEARDNPRRGWEMRREGIGKGTLVGPIPGQPRQVFYLLHPTFDPPRPRVGTIVHVIDMGGEEQPDEAKRAYAGAESFISLMRDAGADMEHIAMATICHLISALGISYEYAEEVTLDVLHGGSEGAR